ncbi:MAG: dethiobiotin synthase [Kofleriaceae bacterium]
MNGLFITGTDTGVGKTFVTTALARHAREIGRRVFAFKPIETGCVLVEGRLVGEDQEALCRAAGNWQTEELRGVYRFARPVAPLVAAEEQQTTIDLGRIDAALARGRSNAELVLVEGAGGWRVPITREVDMGGLAGRIGLPVVLVARASLGTINHTLLSVEAIERDGCAIRAIVLSKLPGEDADFVASNVEQIARRWPGQILVATGRSRELDQLCA